MLDARLGFFTADTTPETVFTNTTGQVTTLESVTVAQPSTAAATTIRLTIGADGATTRWFEQAIPQGVGTYTFPVNQKFTGTEICQASSTSTDDVAVVSLNGRKQLVA